MTQLTLIAGGRAAQTPGVAAGFAVRSPAVGDAGRLGRLYFDAGVPYASLIHTPAVRLYQSFGFRPYAPPD